MVINKIIFWQNPEPKIIDFLIFTMYNRDWYRNLIIAQHWLSL